MTKLVVPRAAIIETAAALRDERGEWELVLWQGRDQDETVLVERLVVPLQRAIRSELGHAVHVDGVELARSSSMRTIVGFGRGFSCTPILAGTST